MEFDPSKITDGFLFKWKIENIYACDNSMNSPLFVATNLEKTEWCMSINRKDALLYLKRIDINSTIKIEVMEVDVVVSVLLSNELYNLLEKKSNLKFRRNDSQYFFLDPAESIFKEKQLIIHCYLQKSEKSIVPLICCTALTHLQSEHRNGIWTVQNFRHLRALVPKSIIFESAGKHLPKIVLTGALFKKSKLFHIRLSIPVHPLYKRVVIVGKVSVLATDGSLKFPTTSCFTFTNESSLQANSKFSEGIPQEAIIQQSDKYLTNGDLLLMCEFFVSKGEVYHEVRNTCHVPNKPKFVIDSYLSSISMKEDIPDIPNVSTEDTGQYTQDLKSSHGFQQPTETLEDDIGYEYLDRKYCDVILTAGNKTFPVHKCILCLKSLVFNTMFETDMRETVNKKVDIDDLDSDTLRRFLLFLYTDKLEILQWEIAAKLYYAADKYQVTSLKAKCSSFLKFHLSVPSVCEALQLADLHQDEDLNLACSNFVLQQDAAKMFSSEEWKSFTVSNPVLSAEILQKYFLMKNSY